MSEQTNGAEPFMTVREMVTEIRADLKELRVEVKEELKGHNSRITVLEGTGLVLRGAWMTLGVSASVVAGAAGLALGVYALF